ncbi:hypothetical protein EW145_g4560 [Phellinidium pouzarii]|uniref:SAP domain-containing protein n=1 Tax=Phellinidium pouzarii TaxID=167371 RepID=A0A4S4L399_9AGAM|nr:hypothetical protein EW145_g4560 [Phellinidium pouzarii]
MHMLRAAVRSSLHPLRAQAHSRRTLVSTVLLSSKTYEEKTIAELRAELRKRGLSASGNKATLITRILQEDARSAAEAPTPSQNQSQSQSQSQTRTVSTSAPSRAEPVATPTPSAPLSPSAPLYSLPIKLPDVSQAPPEMPIAIPFLPDNWNSSAVRAQEQKNAPTSDPAAPKIVLAASASTHPAGGPTHYLSSLSENSLSDFSSSSTSAPPKKFDGLIGDVLDDLGIPHDVFSPSKSSAGEAASESLGSVRSRIQSRPLDADEKRGVYVLLGLLLGSYVTAKVATSPTAGSQAEGH